MQGFNMGRYVPPDLEGTTTGNKIHKKLPPGARASRPGSLTVRFEMPFAVWCGGCPKPTIIGQGVRFNAEKRRVGNYYTSAIWAFRFRHPACGGWIEMRTDPKNTAYVVAEGGKKRDVGEDNDGARGEGDGAILTDKEREALRKNAFASLERAIGDREALKVATERIDDLMDLSSRRWDDPYAQNQKLRRAFRVERKERERLAAGTEALQDRMSLGIDILPESEEDARRAALVDFGPHEDEDEDEDEGGDEGVGGDGGGEDRARHREYYGSASKKALSKPLFPTPKQKASSAASAATPATATAAAASTAAGGKKRLKAQESSLRIKQSLVGQLLTNTRAAKDPFLLPPSKSTSTNSIGSGSCTGFGASYSNKPTSFFSVSGTSSSSSSSSSCPKPASPFPKGIKRKHGGHDHQAPPGTSTPSAQPPASASASAPSSSAAAAAIAASRIQTCPDPPSSFAPSTGLLPQQQHQHHHPQTRPHATDADAVLADQHLSHPHSNPQRSCPSTSTSTSTSVAVVAAEAGAGRKVDHPPRKTPASHNDDDDDDDNDTHGDNHASLNVRAHAKGQRLALVSYDSDSD